MRIISYNLERIPYEIKAVTKYPYFWPDSSLDELDRKYRGDEDKYHTGITVRGGSDYGYNDEVWITVYPDGIDLLCDYFRDLEASEMRAAGYVEPVKADPDSRAHVWQVLQNFNAGRVTI